MVGSQFTEDSEVTDFHEQIWRVLRERGHVRRQLATYGFRSIGEGYAPTIALSFSPTDASCARSIGGGLGDHGLADATAREDHGLFHQAQLGQVPDAGGRLPGSK